MACLRNLVPSNLKDYIENLDVKDSIPKPVPPSVCSLSKLNGGYFLRIFGSF